MKKYILTAALITTVIVGGTFTNSNENASANVPVESVWKPIPVQEKMLNAIDNFQTIKGTYHEIHSPSGADRTVSFQVREGKNPGSYTKVVDNRTGSVVEVRADGNVLMFFDKTNNVFERNRIAKETFNKKNDKPRKFNKNGVTNYVYRQDPSTAILAQDVVFPQPYAFWLNEESGYQVLGNEMYLDRDATVMQGNFDSFMSQKRQATTFKMWVDTDTGVLLKLEESNGTNEIVNSITVTDLKINGTVEEKEFNTTPPTNAFDRSMKDTKRRTNQ